MSKGLLLWGIGLVWCLSVQMDVGANEHELDLLEVSDSLEALSLEELLKINMTSVYGRPENLLTTASAVSLITNEDIRRSGFQSFPEVLRMVPGMQVAQIDGNKWAVSSRGFNQRYSNKLLVLIDGREVYDPAFSGVFWEDNDIFLEDVERIEIIRGPGATIWGSNAVNGVINVLTKDAFDTEGVFFEAGGGTIERGFMNARYGTLLHDDMAMRIYAKVFERAELEENVNGGGGHDDWRGVQTGFRTDWDANVDNRLTLQGDFYLHGFGTQIANPVLTSNPVVTFDGQNITKNTEQHSYGANLLGRWKYQVSEDLKFTTQAYYMRTYRDDAVYNLTRDTVDVSFQVQGNPNEFNQLVAGMGYRIHADDFETTNVLMIGNAEGRKRTDQVFNLFIQDTLELIDDTLYLTAGSKFEYNDYSDFEFQPSARSTWRINDAHALWSSVSYAVRTPSRFEHDLQVNLEMESGPPGFPPAGILPPGAPFSFVTDYQSDSAFDSEDLLALEWGYRYMPSEKFSFDISAFYNMYSNLRTFEVQPLSLTAATREFRLTTAVENHAKAETYGVELQTSWQVLDPWELTFGYSWLDMEYHFEGGVDDRVSAAVEKTNPQQTFQILSRLDLPYNLEFDQSLYWVDQIDPMDIRRVMTTSIDDYLRLDLRVGWKPTEHLEVSFIAQNLLDPKHQEYGNTFLDEKASEVPRSFMGKVTFRY